MVSVQPELWVDHPSAAVEFYHVAFGARVVHMVGDGDDIVAQLVVGDAAFWVGAVDPDAGRISAATVGGRTSRTLLVVDDPDRTTENAVAAGARLLSEVADEHGWRIGRIMDPYGHEWEIGRPLGPWPPEVEPAQ